MSSSLPVLCSFHTPVEPALVALTIPRTVLRACHALDGKLLALDRAVRLLCRACSGIGVVTVEEDHIIWEVRYSAAEIADATERALDLAERDDGSPDQAGLIWNEGESRPMTNAEVRQLVQVLRESDEVSVNYAVLIRFRPVGKLKAN